jgi:hypothetical protein
MPCENNGRIRRFTSRSDAAHRSSVASIDAPDAYDLRIMVTHGFRVQTASQGKDHNGVIAWELVEVTGVDEADVIHDANREWLGDMDHAVQYPDSDRDLTLLSSQVAGAQRRSN